MAPTPSTAARTSLAVFMVPSCLSVVVQGGCQTGVAVFLGNRAFRAHPSTSAGSSSTIGMGQLFGPDEDLRPAPVFLIEQQSGAAAFHIVERQADTARIDVDALVVEERHIPRRHDAEQPERNVD